MIELAREEMQLSQSALSALIGVSQGTLSRIEAELISLTEEVEAKLVSALDKPREFFHYRGPIEAPTFVLYRKKSQIPPDVARCFWAKITVAAVHVRQLLTGAELTAKLLPYFDPDECPGGVVEVARRIRRMLKVPPGPIRNLMHLVEGAGCLVVRTDFGTRKIDGCCGFIDHIPVIFINEKLSAVRQRLTIVHELGHLIMHRFPDEHSESQAFLFAAEFLMPEEEIRPMLSPLSFDRLARLKLYWQVSMKALIKRAEGLGIISHSTVRYYWAKMEKSGFREQEPYDDELLNETPTLLMEIVSTYVSELEYTDKELSTLIMVPTERFLKSFVGEGNYLRVVK
jgi:Zn-dependent peptidase ImmA (M78 family)/transcriptional regulator with XRE-family HTH domain